jgi:sugar lactone lactonase YvrE
MKRHTFRLAPLLAISLSPLVAQLIAAGSASAAEFGSLPPAQAETLVSFPEGNSLEGIAIHKDSMYVGNRRRTEQGLVSEIIRIDPDGNVSPFALFDPPATAQNVEGVLGLAIGRQGDVLAAVHTLDPATHGVWRISEAGEMQRIPGSESISFPNALTFDARGNLYVTDSLRITDSGGLSGGVWRFSRDGESELWLEHAALSPITLNHPLGIPPVGANGIAFYPPAGLYIANLQVGQIVNVPIKPDGSPGEPTVVAEGVSLTTIDGLAVDVHGHIHGVLPGFAVATAIGLPVPEDGLPPIVEIDPATGEVTRSGLAEFDGIFDFPTSLAFDGESVFVVTAALRGFSPVPIPEPGSAVIEVGVGVRGFPRVAVPEPSSWLLLLIGTALFGVWRRIHRQGSAAYHVRLQ